jgi:lysophospholipase L1-like esterase
MRQQKSISKQRRIGIVLLVTLISVLSTPLAQAGRHCRSNRWVGTWSTSPQPPIMEGYGEATIAEINDETMRQTVRISLGGEMAQVRLTNEFGDTPLVIGSAHIALSDGGEYIIPDTSRQLTFGGETSITIPPGAPMLSDPVEIDLPPLSDVTISIYFPEATPTTTFHSVAARTTYLSVSGDFTDVAEFPTAMETYNYYFVSGVSVLAPKKAAAIVAFGDSITDGVGSTLDANEEWPSILAARLQDRHFTDHLAVVNEGISGNRVLNEEAGPNALKRFDRDVLRQPGVAYVIVLEGINDIGFSGFIPEQNVSAQQIITGHRQLIARAHEQGLKIFGATLTPFGGLGAPYETPEGEAKRQAINEWIRTSGEYDAVIDFDAVTRDPENPTALFPLYDSGDHLHPSSAGYEAMANAIDLHLFNSWPLH